MVSCEKDDMSRGGGRAPISESVVFEVNGYDNYVCGEKEVTLWAGQHIDAGTVNITDDGVNLYFEYNLDLVDAEFGELHLWVGTDVSTLPTTPTGVPISGHFPYKTDDTGATEFTFVVPLEDFVWECDETKFYFVAHAEIYYLEDGERTGNDDTAFGGEYPGDSPRWYFWDYYVICCDDNGNGDNDCQTETAFGGDTAGEGAAWWYYYDAYVGGVQTIWAGQTIDVGTVEVVDGTVTIVLTNGWELKDGNETVKIKGYDEIPGSRPAAGLFTGEGTYKGTDLDNINVGEYAFYVIHLDVQKCEPVR
ncbi:MAG: hypothetical protein EA408_08295 [Marinilabiliales bacterium]|nr:MAG: hypothetical protein EA408_08295 [Marinilabiliales bacterium]